MDDLSKAQKAAQKDGLGSKGKGREAASETSAPLARMTLCISCGCGIQTHGSNGLTIETQATAQTFSADFSVAIAAGARSLQKKTRHCTSTHRHHLDSAAKVGGGILRSKRPVHGFGTETKKLPGGQLVETSPSPGCESTVWRVSRFQIPASLAKRHNEVSREFLPSATSHSHARDY